MNRRTTTSIACGIGLLTTLILLATSVPWFAGVTRESGTSLLQAATNKWVLFPQRAPVPSTNKRRSTTTQAALLPTVLPVLDRAAITPAHRALAQTVLTTLPPSCRTHLQSFYVIYDNARQRGLGGKTTIILDGSVSDAEFIGLLIHECGHVTHSNLTGTSSTGDSDFIDGKDPFYTDSTIVDFFRISWNTESILKQSTHAEDFVSGYAKTNAFEDFAETFTAYVLHRSLLQTRALTNTAIAAKLSWMEENLPLPENTLAHSTYVVGRTIPWDMTKLPMTL